MGSFLNSASAVSFNVSAEVSECVCVSCQSSEQVSIGKLLLPPQRGRGRKIGRGGGEYLPCEICLILVAPPEGSFQLFCLSLFPR